MVLSPKAAGVGLTITAANHVIHLSRWWNPAVEDQCNDRVYRIGQSKAVTVHVPWPCIRRSATDPLTPISTDCLNPSARCRVTCWRRRWGKPMSACSSMKPSELPKAGHRYEV